MVGRGVPPPHFGGAVLEGASVGAGVFGFVTFFFAAGFFTGSVSSTTIFFGGGGGATDSVLICARKRVNSSSLPAASLCTRSPNVRRAFSKPVISLLRLLNSSFEPKA